MNKFTEAEACAAKSIAEDVRLSCEWDAKRYAKPEDQSAAAVALLAAVVELLQGEKRELSEG